MSLTNLNLNIDELLKLCTKGQVEFSADDKLSDVRKSIPKGYGVYLFYENDIEGEILYIGKAGTVEQDGKFKAQQLRDRVKNKQGEMLREKFFKEKLRESSTLKRVVVQWYIVNSPAILPAYLEALLIQNFYAKHKKLPQWNKSF